MQRASLTPSWVLHSRPFRETSLIVDALTLEQGRMSLLAKGVRGAAKSQARSRGLLQPFQPLLLSFSGRADLKTLSHIEAGSKAATLKGDAMLAGFYCNELLQRLLPSSEVMPSLFEAYSTAIDACQTQWPVAIRRFELTLLDELGYSLNLIETADGHVVQPQRCYYYVVEQGLHLHTSQAPSQYPKLDGSTCLALAAGNIAQADASQAAQLLKSCLHYYLGPKPLRTRELWKAFKANAAKSESPE